MMNANRKLLLTAVAAFTGGVISGAVIAPRSSHRLGRMLACRMPLPADWVEDQLQRVGQQLASLEKELLAGRAGLGEKLQALTDHAIDPCGPLVPDDVDAWQVEDVEVARELRRMPRR